MDTPQVWVWRPSPARLPNLHPDVGLETSPGQIPQPPSWVWAWRPPSPVNRILDTRHTLLKILPSLRAVINLYIIMFASSGRWEKFSLTTIVSQFFFLHKNVRIYRGSCSESKLNLFSALEIPPPPNYFRR